MPPELLMEGRVSPAADVFAFAVVVVGMFNPGKQPWHGHTSWQVCAGSLACMLTCVCTLVRQSGCGGLDQHLPE